MARDRSVNVRLRASVSEFTGPLKQAKKAVEDVAKGAETSARQSKGVMSSVAQSARENKDAWTDVGGALTAYGAAVTGIGAAVLGVGINYNTLRQRSVAALTTLTGSAEAANAQMDKLDDFASNSPFARDVFIRAQQQLIGFGREAEEVVPILDAIQNAVAATGGSNQDIEELVRIIAQVGAAGKITAEDLNQFGQRGVDAATLIGSQMGKTGQQIRDEITAGTLDADAAIAALTDGMSERFGGAAANVKGTMDGAVDRVKAAFRDIGASFASVLVDPQGGGLLIDGFNGLADALRAFEDLPGPIKNTVGALAGVSGVASLAAGGFLLLAPRALETWDALGKMGPAGELAKGGLRGLGGIAKTAAIGLGALGLLGALSAAGDAMNDFELSTEDAENRLRTFQDTATGGDLLSFDPGAYGGFQTLLDDLSDDGWWRPIHGNIADFGDGLGSLFGQDTRSDFYKFRDDMAAFDGVLAGMATESLPEANEHFARLVDLTDGSNESILKLIDSLPGYREHLVGVANELGIAADDTNILRIATGELKPPLDEAGEAAAGAAEKVATLNGEFVKVDPSILQGKADEVWSSTRDILAAFINLGEGLNEEDITLEGWLTNLEAQMAAQAAAAENRAYLIGKGISAEVVDGLLAEPGGAEMAQTIVDEIESGNGSDVIARLKAVGSAMTGDILKGATDEATAADPIILDAEIQLEAGKAQERREELQSAFLRDGPVELPVDADDTPARQTIADYVLFALQHDPAVVKFDADGSLAEVSVENWNAMADNQVGMPKLDADPARAKQQLADYLGDAADTTGVALLDANGNPAQGTTDAWAWRAGNTGATADLYADASSAYATLFAFARRAANTSVSIGLGASPGFDSGGYTGYGSKYAPAGIVHADEFVHTKENLSKPGMLQFHTDLWRSNDLDGAYTRHKLRGYADGGPVGMAPQWSAPAAGGGAVQQAAPIDYGRLGATVADALLSAMKPLDDYGLYTKAEAANRRFSGARGN